MDQDELRSIPDRILREVGRYVQGKDELQRLLIVTLLSAGHVLVEGMPGSAKTLTTRSFAQAIGGKFRRVQLTPDMLPGDVTGFNLYHPDGKSEFVPGPIFANVVLADELNRTTPRTQSAFLEAMEERQVTVEGTTHSLPHPFCLVASQVPFGGDGTYQLADVQADRFLFRVWSSYPEREAEARVLLESDTLEDPHIEAVTNPEQVLELRSLVKKTHVSDLVLNYILDLVEQLRADPDILQSPSPRASLALFRGSRALAFLEGRDYAIPDDVRELVLPAFEHRVRPTMEAELDGVTPRTLVERALGRVEVPKGSVD